MLRVTERCDQLGWPYFVTGSAACLIHGEGRNTYDVDVVVRMPKHDAGAICEPFQPPDYYADPQSAEETARRGGQFNIVWATKALKADIIAPRSGGFTDGCFERARRETFNDGTAIVLSREDLIVNKLDFYQQGGSDKLIRDIVGVMRVAGPKLDRVYIEKWVTQIRLEEEWQAVLERYARPCWSCTRVTSLCDVRSLKLAR